MSDKRLFRTQSILLKWLGVQWSTSENSRKSINKVICVHLALVTFLLSSILQFLYKNFTDIRLMTDALGPMFTIVITVVKMLVFWQNKGQLCHFMSDLQATMNSNTNIKDEKLIAAAYKFDKIFAIGYSTLTLSCGVIFVCLPLALGLYGILTAGTTIWVMPIQVSFFYDTSSPAVFIVTYLIVTMAIFSVIFGATAVDSMYAGSIIVFCTHFRILQRRFQNLTGNDLRADGQSKLNDTFGYHIRILELCETFKDLYQPVILAQFLLSSLLLCVLGFQLTMSFGHSVSMAIHISFIVAVISQLYKYAQGGQHLITESQQVSNAIYCSAWYEADPKVRKMLLLALMRAQKAVIVDGVFFEAGLPSFTSILSTAASYTTFLQSMDK